MPSERFLSALSRIEAAARRLESAAQRPAVPSGDGDIAARHDRLRAASASALARLDALIAANGG